MYIDGQAEVDLEDLKLPVVTESYASAGPDAWPVVGAACVGRGRGSGTSLVIVDASGRVSSACARVDRVCLGCRRSGIVHCRGQLSRCLGA